MGELTSLRSLAEQIRADLAAGRLKLDESRWECPECFGSGWRQVPNPNEPRNDFYTGVVKCLYCRYWDIVRERALAA